MSNAIHQRIVSTAASNVKKTQMRRNVKILRVIFMKIHKRILLFFSKVQLEIISVHISTLWTHKITFFCIIIMSKNESAKSHQFQRDKTLLIRTRVWSFNGMEKSRRNWSEENDVSCVWHWTQVQVRHRRSVPLWKEILMLILRNVNLMFRGIR